jgi:hypothetical protein
MPAAFWPGWETNSGQVATPHPAPLGYCWTRLLVSFECKIFFLSKKAKKKLHWGLVYQSFNLGEIGSQKNKVLSAACTSPT